MKSYTITSHILDALDVYLEGYQSDHSCGMVSDEDMQEHEKVYAMCLDFILDELPEMRKACSI